LDTKNYKHHPGSFYTSRLLNESIEQVESSQNYSTVKCKNFKSHKINKLINSYNKIITVQRMAHKKCYQGAELED
jgi:hypothetical protein